MSVNAAIERGESYLLERIRARELVTQAPSEASNKRFDGYGEPYLALDPLLALAERIPTQDRQDLADRLLRSQRMGAWDYTGQRGLDVDTTAAAIRALDRLGHRVPLDGLGRFFDRRTGLFNTFPTPQTAVLRLPPQSIEKHIGAHPCVLANLLLLLRERGKVSNINHALLGRLQKPNGNWFSYFYPSPFYSTRLFMELLTSLSEEYDRYLRSTLNSLLGHQPTNSPTQSAEVLISLDCLRRRFAADQASIGRKAAVLLQQVSASQSGDGSWPGEVIWEFLDWKSPDPANPTVVIGFDQFRVRSTALCVRAMKIWA